VTLTRTNVIFSQNQVHGDRRRRTFAVPPGRDREERETAPAVCSDRGGSVKRYYRYVPVFVAVSIARPASWFFPVTSVRM
jgi:hypothetical protein